MEKTNTNTGSKYILVLDCISISLSYFLAAWIRGGILVPQFFTTMYGFMYIVILLGYVTIHYMRHRGMNIFKRGFLSEFSNVIKEQVELLLVIISVLYITKQVGYSRAFLLIFFLLSTSITYIVRSYAKVLMLLGYKKSKFSSKVFVITESDRAEAQLRKMKSEYYYNFTIEGLGIMDKSMVGESIYGIPVTGDRDTIIDVIKQQVVDEVFICLPSFKRVELNELLLSIEQMGVIVHLGLNVSDRILVDVHEKRISTFAGQHVITYSSKLFNHGQVVMKRIIDIIGSIFGLILTGVLTIIIGPLILTESKGPLFFSQIRVGKNGRQFKIYKFRSMCQDAEERKVSLMEQNEMVGGMFKMTNDPRVTKIGRFIRKTSIDEFPQFFNVLRGDMSLVGTRPPTLDEFNRYEGRHKRRLSFKPGLTGLWQVSGRSDINEFEEVVRLDLEYIDNWSIGLDLKLILKTIQVIIVGKGSK